MFSPHVTAYKNQHYEELRRQSQERAQLFEDPEFPCVDSSLFFSKPPPGRVEWKRPKVTQTHTHIHTHTHAYTQTPYIHTHKHVYCTYTHTHTYTQTPYIHTHTHIYTQLTYTDRHTHILYIHTYTHSPLLELTVPLRTGSGPTTHTDMSTHTHTAR